MATPEENKEEKKEEKPIVPVVKAREDDDNDWRGELQDHRKRIRVLERASRREPATAEPPVKEEKESKIMDWLPAALAVIAALAVAAFSFRDYLRKRNEVPYE